MRPGRADRDGNQGLYWMPPASSRGLRSDAPSSSRLSRSHRRFQELASFTVRARQPRLGALPPSRHTHSQATPAGYLFLAGLRTADGQWQCPVIGADRKSLADEQNGALDPFRTRLREPAVARQGRRRSARRPFLLIQARSRSGLAIGRSRQVTQTSSFSI